MTDLYTLLNELLDDHEREGYIKTLESSKTLDICACEWQDLHLDGKVLKRRIGEESPYCPVHSASGLLFAYVIHVCNRLGSPFDTVVTSVLLDANQSNVPNESTSTHGASDA